MKKSLFSQPAEVDMPSTSHHPQHTPLDEDAFPDLSEQLRAALIRLVTQVDRERLEPLAEPGWHTYMEIRGEANPSDRFLEP
jgi:hypothetical protein